MSKKTVSISDLEGLPSNAKLTSSCGAIYSADYNDYSFYPIRKDGRFRCSCKGKPFLKLTY